MESQSGVSLHLQSSDTNPLLPQDRIVSYIPLASTSSSHHPPALQAVHCPSKKERMNRSNRELRVAARENNLPEISRLLSVGADVNAKDNNGVTPLHWACFKGHVQVVTELLDHGVDFEAKDMYGWTPLHRACYNAHVAVGNELLSRGANIEAKTNIGDTPLHKAAEDGNLAIVKALLDGGANILAANNNGRLPIHQAAGQGNSAAAKTLLQMFYATICRLPLHELLKDLTWIGDPNSHNILDVPLLRVALHWNVLRMDDVETLHCSVLVTKTAQYHSTSPAVAALLSLLFSLW
jgi:hypothetical protein